MSLMTVKSYCLGLALGMAIYIWITRIMCWSHTNLNVSRYGPTYIENWLFLLLCCYMGYTWDSMSVAVRHHNHFWIHLRKLSGFGRKEMFCFDLICFCTHLVSYCVCFSSSVPDSWHLTPFPLHLVLSMPTPSERLLLNALQFYIAATVMIWMGHLCRHFLSQTIDEE